MRYVDGFVFPMKKKNLPAYRRMALKAKTIWMDHGALQYCETVGDDFTAPVGIQFPKLAKCKAGETVVFSFVVFKSRAHRDRANVKIMQDPRMAAMMNMKKMPFDCRRMTMGGFKMLVDA